MVSITARAGRDQCGQELIDGSMILNKVAKHPQLV
jgi:hypothetical protein